MRELVILYDDACALCVRCADWLGSERAFVPLRLLPAASAEARARYRDVPWLGSELVVASDEGDVWAGPAAFLVCLWALEAWREWADVLASPLLVPIVARFFRALSSRRAWFGAFLRPDACEHEACLAHVRPVRQAAYR
jgi:predicted DCC family thiol-disulfide oxidoreductase YuxK